MFFKKKKKLDFELFKQKVLTCKNQHDVVKLLSWLKNFSI